MLTGLTIGLYLRKDCKEFWQRSLCLDHFKSQLHELVADAATGLCSTQEK
jgi:hypothetical protein